MVPDGWTKFTLGSILEFKNGVNTDAINYGHGTKFVNVMDVFRSTSLTHGSIRGSVQVGVKQQKAYALRLGDILFNRTSETPEEIAFASVYLDNKPAIFGGFVIRGRPVGGHLDPHYSKYCFTQLSVRRELIRRCQGAIRGNIGQKDMRKVPITLPSLSEQREIAKIIHSWDRAIETVEKLIDNSERQKKALIVRLLGGCEKFAGSASGNSIRKPLHEMALVEMGSSPKSQNYNSTGVGLPLVQGNADIKNRQAAPRVFTSQITKSCEPGDILLSVRAPVGEVARTSIKACIGRGIAFIRPKRQSDSEFLYQYLLSFETKWARLAQGSTFSAVNGTEIRNLTFNVPKEPESRAAIGRKLRAADREITLLKNQCDLLNIEKRALMQQLLTGKRRVKVSQEAA